jgi:glycosyltransferase involved in cell wall biosynthesis
MAGAGTDVVGAVSQAVVVVPCYDEESRLAVDEFTGFAKRGRAKLLFVDDGSRDATLDLLHRMEASDPVGIEVLSFARNRGKAEAVRAGLLHALAGGADVVAYLDADLATPIQEMERLLEEREQLDADVVLAARVGLLGWNIRRRPLRHYLGRVFATSVSLLLRLRVYDTQCGAKVFRRTAALQSALAEPFRSRWIFDVELLARLLTPTAQGEPEALEVIEIPLREWSDVQGSKLRATAMVGILGDLVVIGRQLRRSRRST